MHSNHTMPTPCNVMIITDKREGMSAPQLSSGHNALILALMNKVRRISAPVVLCTTLHKGSRR